MGKNTFSTHLAEYLTEYTHSEDISKILILTFKLLQMAQMDDENLSQAITQAGGCLTLHSKWKSQFDDSEASENETEMKGENLQSPEHKQGDSPGTGGQAQDQTAPSAARQLELSR